MINTNLAESHLLSAQDYQHYFEAGISYEEYIEHFDKELSMPPVDPNGKYLPINRQRIRRIEKTIVLLPEVLSAVRELITPIKWLTITEHWCGDAAQSIPVMHRIALASDCKIDLRFVYRDLHPALMSAHLTGTSKSIPILIQLDMDYTLLGTWGPRPAPAQELAMRLRSDPKTLPTYGEELHKWYTLDKQVAIQMELVDLLRIAIQRPPY